MRRFLGELKRRNVIRVGGVYAVSAWGLFIVAKTVFETLQLPRWAPLLTFVLLVLGLPIALILAWAFERGPDGQVVRTAERPHDAAPVRLGWIDGALLAGMLLVISISVMQVLGLAGRSGPATPAGPAGAPNSSVAVLPFSNFSERPDADFFADGLTEELINSLAQIPGLKVAGRTSAFYFKGRNEDLRQIGRSLGVAHVIEGSVRRDGERLRVTAQLIKVSDGFHVWSKTYDAQMKDGLEVQTQIATAVADALKLKLMAGAAATPRDRDPEGYRMELVAKAQARGLGLQELTEARRTYQSLIKLEPDNAEAYAGLASTTSLLAQNYLTLDFKTAEGESRAAIAKALELNPRSPAAWIAKGLLCRILVIRSDDQPCVAEGQAALKRAVELGPRDPDALTLYGEQLSSSRPEEAIVYLRRAIAIDPLNRLALNALASAYLATGRASDAEHQLQANIAIYPDFVDAKQSLGELYVRQGRLDRAVPWLKAAAAPATDPSAAIELANVYFNLGMPKEALATLATIKAPPVAAAAAQAIRLMVAADYPNLRSLGERTLKANGDPFWRSVIATSSIMMGDFDRAREQLLVTSPELFEPTPKVSASLVEQAVGAAFVADQLGDHGQARRILQAALAASATGSGALVTPTTRIAHMRAYALLGRRDDAIAELKAAVAGGYRQVWDMESFLRLDRDPRLKSLWSDPAFRAAIAQIEADNTRMRQALITNQGGIPS